jgi:hypothetical protein
MSESFMKKFVVLLLLLSVPFVVFGQKSSKQDSPFGFGLSYYPVWLIPDVSAVNKNLSAASFSEFPTAGFIGGGGSAFVYISALPNFRFGVVTIGGSSSETVTKNSYQLESEITTGFTGMSVEYTLPFVRSFGISIGTVIGGGSTEISLHRHSGVFTWNNIWNDLADPNKGSLSYSRELNHSYFTVAPTLNVEFPMYRFLAFRIGAGYSIPFGKSWTMDNEQELSDVPSDISSGGFFTSAAIFVGIFGF